MSARNVEIDMALWCDRYMPASVPLDMAKVYADSGIVDYVQGWDQLVSWWPANMWTAENTPGYAFSPDPDSFPDWIAILSAAAAVAPGLGTAMSLDSIRRGPAELMQTMLTMANLTQGHSMFHFGAGEIKQTKPFGYKRSEGLGRLEDLFRLFHLLLENEAPFDFEGNYWKFEQASIGYGRPYRPQFWGLGGGPKLLDLSTSYADGFATMARMVATSPEHWAEWIASMKEDLERKGRDPESFGFGLYVPMLIHEDLGVLENALENPLLKFVAGIEGRINQSDWAKEGIEPVMPLGWHYAMKLMPHLMPKAEVDDIVDRTTLEMVRKTYVLGTPQQVADELSDWVEAGATWIHFIDMLPTVLEPENAAKAPGRSLEAASILKGQPITVVAGTP